MSICARPRSASFARRFSAMRTRPKSSPSCPPVCSPPENRHLASQIEESITETERVDRVDRKPNPDASVCKRANRGGMLPPALEVTQMPLGSIAREGLPFSLRDCWGCPATFSPSKQAQSGWEMLVSIWCQLAPTVPVLTAIPAHNSFAVCAVSC